jgi:hypothetical protein
MCIVLLSTLCMSYFFFFTSHTLSEIKEYVVPPAMMTKNQVVQEWWHLMKCPAGISVIHLHSCIMMHTVNSRLFHYKRQASFEITKTYIHTTHVCYKPFLLFATWTLAASCLALWLGWCFLLRVLQSCRPLPSHQSDHGWSTLPSHQSEHGVENIGVGDPFEWLQIRPNA